MPDANREPSPHDPASFDPILSDPASSDPVAVLATPNETHTRTLLEHDGHRINVEHHTTPLVRINAPQLYRDPAFRAWLDDEAWGPATWHARGLEPGEYSDVFTSYGGGYRDDDGRIRIEGSDIAPAPGQPGLPEAFHPLIAAAVERATGSMANEALLWISNLPGGDEEP